jgi:CRP-like cAMP-binding protein
MEILREQLNAECSYRMRPETMDLFLGLMSEMTLKQYETLIDYGSMDSNIYVVRSGIIRSAYFNGFKEMTLAFGTAGTMLSSYYPFYKREPSFFKHEACCKLDVMKITRVKFLELTRQSHDFAQWAMWMSWSQLWLYEKKLEVVNGDAKERFEAMLCNRPEIIEKVPMKYVASYIGVSPQYLCKMKRMFKLRSAE